MAHYAMVIDTKSCCGCQTCAVACKTVNNLPKGVWYNRVITVGGEASECAGGSFPDCTMHFRPQSCQHCENPACVSVCPTGASYVADGGIVRIDGDKCIGCQACIAACPYDARTLIDPEPIYYIDGMTLGDPLAPVHVGGAVEKCDFCYDRIFAGEQPACMELCPARARYWGDIDDPDSDVSKLISEREYELYLEDQGTQPSVYYLK